MTRRLRLVLPAAALVAVVAALLTLGPLISQPPASAADPPPPTCQPLVGDHMLGTALLHVPPHPRAPLALVLAFHGAGGNGPDFAKESGLSATADEHGFAVLYPTAGSSKHFWSLNDAMQPNDVSAVAALLPRAEADACADTTRIYATGVSNGGGFTARIGCELAGTIAAIAPVAGGYKGLDPCPSGRRISVLEIHGTKDQIVPYDGRKGDGAGSVASYMAGWVARDGCSSATRQTHPLKGVTRFLHRDCPAGLAVEHLRLAGTDHGWPGAAPPWPAHNP
jgi:polyhydroxybutyrate depolymerase